MVSVKRAYLLPEKNVAEEDMSVPKDQKNLL